MRVYSIPLSNNGEPILTGDGQFLRLPEPEEPYVLRFVIFAWSALGYDGSLWCNVPPKDHQFERNNFIEYKISTSFSHDCCVDIPITQSGPFSFYCTYRPSIEDGYFENKYNKQTELQKTKLCHFIVSTRFYLDDKLVPLNSLAIQTVVSKFMGTCSSWDPKLNAIREKGYNMIHFTPLQKRGHSNSPFSIYDQLDWDPACFPNGITDVKQIVQKMKDMGLLSLSDIVLNHTADNSQWLRDYPEAGYSVDTAPHLKPALELDDKLLEYSTNLESLGLPIELHGPDDLDRVVEGIKDHVLNPLKLWQYYVVNVPDVTHEIRQVWCDAGRLDQIEAVPIPEEAHTSLTKLAEFVVSKAAISFDSFGERFAKSLNIEIFVGILKSLISGHGIEERAEAEARRIIDEINDPFYKEFDDDCDSIIQQVRNRAQYTRLDGHGPKLGPFTKEHPLIDTYFTRFVSTDGKPTALVNNGWVWNGDPLIDFASAASKAYLRREVIIWGDCVKLRYGSGPEDNPFLWEHMEKYARLLAEHFHGLRMDNCHSTPLHVGEYFLDKARQVRPNLYVVAELFTGSEEKDKMFVERLGITSLIREAMQPWSVQELSRIVHKHGGRPIGSFSKQPLVRHGLIRDKTDDEDVFLVRSSPIHALFMDCTHDNETPNDKRTVEDTLPTAALVAMCACAVGSNVGFDECYPHVLDIVKENRLYTFDGGIGKIKRILNDMHIEMADLDSDETYLHHEGQYITFHRVDPITGKGWFLIARTKFLPEGDQIINLERTGDARDDSENLDGIPTRLVDLEKPNVEYDEQQRISYIRGPRNFPQGSIALFKTSSIDVEPSLDELLRGGADEAVKDLNLIDLNVLLYKSEGEERDSSHGADGVYNIPNYGALTYAGIQGWISPLAEAVAKNDLGHPICDHLRQGNWALDYMVGRLRRYQDGGEYNNFGPLIDWLQERIDRIKWLPGFLIPRHFALLLFTIYSAIINRGLQLFPSNLRCSSSFIHKLAFTSIQMVGIVPSTSLLPFEKVACMAAGLPHFSVGYMRCWGRDVFLSTGGLLLTVGRFQEAKEHILGFAATLKHGLIPNLLDAGRNPRYNARDATWFFLQIVQEYYLKAPDGKSILDESVKRRFPLDDTYVSVDDSRAFRESSTIKEIVFEILQRHAQGIQFREANAGPNLDSQMRDEGFNQRIYVDWSNGIIFGGNQWNCGTWMDKMGESERAGNKGVPGTPRDGAAIEITGLLKSTLRWVNQLVAEGAFEWDHVVNQDDEKVSLKVWEEKIQESFEYAYYIPENEKDDYKYEVDKNIVNRRGIYKDLYRSGKPYEDYQLRPNFAIAMVVAPELFDIDHAIHAIGMADKIIRGPVGMATLDPSDYNYRPYYVNGVDSDDFATSKGRNYHQGPEWVWCTGYFLRALFLFDKKRRERDGLEMIETVFQLQKRLQGHVSWIDESHWAGLTELTQKNGELCPDSSPTQAWSSATLLDLYSDVSAAEL